MMTVAEALKKNSQGIWAFWNVIQKNTAENEEGGQEEIRCFGRSWWEVATAGVHPVSNLIEIPSLEKTFTFDSAM